MSVFKNVADIQTADMLKLPVPEAHYHLSLIHIYRYELRHGDEDWGEPRELARGLMVNFYGTVLTLSLIHI